MGAHIQERSTMRLTSLLAQPLWRYYAKPRSSYTLREIIRRMLTTQPVRILQVGANNGISADPIHPLLLRHKTIHATRVEPLAEPFKQLQLNSKRYAASTELFNVCVSNHDGILTMEIPKQKISGAPDTYQASISRKSSTGNSEETTIEDVTSVTFETLYSLMNEPRADIYVSDCEGYDIELLEQCPLNKLGIRVVYVELWDNPHSPELTGTALARASAFLGRHGFTRIVWDGQDYLSWKSPRFS
jgi:FkbM family methyltransferase